MKLWHLGTQNLHDAGQADIKLCGAKADIVFCEVKAGIVLCAECSTGKFK